MSMADEDQHSSDLCYRAKNNINTLYVFIKIYCILFEVVLIRYNITYANVFPDSFIDSACISSIKTTQDS